MAPLGVADRVADHIGGFVVTAGHEEIELAERFEAANDDYSSIMLKALADRLAEAFAERMHQLVRTDLWGYAADEQLSATELLAERFRGIRPAPGYPCQPDHSEKAILFDLLDAPNAIGVRLTESYAMWPGSSVSGLYFAHPESKYFGVGKIQRDQLESYAKRKGWTVEEAEHHTSPRSSTADLPSFAARFRPLSGVELYANEGCAAVLWFVARLGPATGVKSRANDGDQDT